MDIDTPTPILCGMLRLTGDIACIEAAERLERAYERILSDCECPFCGETERCEEECSFADDFPDDFERMKSARFVLCGEAS